MSGTKLERRRETLAMFADWAAAAGHPVPTSAELDDVAANPDRYLERLTSPEVKIWARTIDELLLQVRMGMYPGPANHGLADEFRRPTGKVIAREPSDERATTPVEPGPGRNASNSTVKPDSKPNPSGAAAVDEEDPVVEAMLAWKALRIAEGETGAEAIRDLTLRNLAKGGSADEQQIARQLGSTGNAHLAPEIARIIAQLSGASATAPPPPSDGRSTPVDVPTPAPPRHPTAPRETPPTAPRSQVDSHPTPSAQPREADVASLRHQDFEPYSHESHTDSTPAPLRVRSVGGKVRLSYEPHIAAGKMVVYRIVSGDDVVPYRPEAGHLIAATTALSVDDERPLSGAVRNYQVWCHVGTDLEDARRNQPFLLAAGEEVSPVQDFKLHQDEGRVIGEWRVYDQTIGVSVFRVLLEEGADATSIVDDPADRILGDRDNLKGFVDTEAVPGSRYAYRVMTEAAVGNGTRLSRAEQREIQIDVVLSPVDDLNLTTSDDDGGQFDLLWTNPPIGEVRVYRTKTPPAPTLRDLTDLEMSALAREESGFDDENRVKYPPEPVGEFRTAITGVPWPTGWDRAYFTPVTYLGTTVRVGTTKVETRPLPPVRDAELVERFDTEMIKFSWPAGAVSVWVFVGSTTLGREDICSREKPDEEISKSKHLRDGGHTFARPLEAKGCTVCLVPVHYAGYDLIRGRITALNYPGLHRIRYHLMSKNVPGRDIRELGLSNDMELDSSISFVLRYLPDRLPLSADDGQVLPFTPPRGGNASAHCLFEQGLRKGDQPTGWTIELTGLDGFVRLFVVPQGDTSKRFALADPSVRELFLPLPITEPS